MNLHQNEWNALAQPGGPADPSAPARAHASIFIAASVDQVWAILTNFEGWPRWNSDVSTMTVSGPLSIGTVLKWKSGGLPIRSEIDRLERPTAIGWRGRAPLMRAQHVYLLQERDGGTQVETFEAFFGPIAKLLPGSTGRMLANALHSGNEMLKRACETGLDGVRAASASDKVNTAKEVTE